MAEQALTLLAAGELERESTPNIPLEARDPAKLRALRNAAMGIVTLATYSACRCTRAPSICRYWSMRTNARPRTAAIVENDARGEEVLAYVEKINRAAGFDTRFAWDGDTVRIVS
jgi:hypothetical protein